MATGVTRIVIRFIVVVLVAGAAQFAAVKRSFAASHSSDCGNIPTMAEFPAEVVDSATPRPNECGPGTVALMMSGQFSRFIYKDETGPLLAPPPEGCDPPAVDVYIALHNGTMAVPWQGVIKETPYATNTTVASIQEWYVKRGARTVTINLISDDQLDKMKEDIWPKLVSRRFDRQDTFREFVEEHAKGQFNPYSRMFYLRHLAYRMTLTQSQNYNYDAYASLREDNYFFEPLNLIKIGWDQKQADSSTPYVMVEKFCAWSGSYSNKLHVGNGPSMVALFGSTWTEFAQLMVRWVDFSYIREQLDGFFQPFQTESFLNDLLATATVVPVDFKRMEMRYNNDRMCVQDIYLECVQKDTDWYTTELSRRGITKCGTGTKGNVIDDTLTKRRQKYYQMTQEWEQEKKNKAAGAPGTPNERNHA